MGPRSRRREVQLWYGRTVLSEVTLDAMLFVMPQWLSAVGLRVEGSVITAIFAYLKQYNDGRTSAYVSRASSPAGCTTLRICGKWSGALKRKSAAAPFELLACHMERRQGRLLGVYQPAGRGGPPPG